MASAPGTDGDPLTVAAEALRTYAAAAARLEQSAGNEAGLVWSACEASFLTLLQLHGSLSPGELSEMAQVSSSGTTTGAIDRLEKAGYVRRDRSTHDRRKVIVTLTPEAAAGHRRARQQRLTELFADYKPSQQRLIAEFLTRLAETETHAATT
ncbi:MAG: MarR family transcriptional regulator [Streptosporangiales bacterium]|nr:MarR family transcriptional regulator [Streptosporangiales bacterium]